MNERLFSAGLVDSFDAAARRRDRASMIAILNRVTSSAQAEEITDEILANPQCYGF